jgi:hypothetical protein
LGLGFRTSAPTDDTRILVDVGVGVGVGGEREREREREREARVLTFQNPLSMQVREHSMQVKEHSMLREEMQLRESPKTLNHKQ